MWSMGKEFKYYLRKSFPFRPGLPSPVHPVPLLRELPDDPLYGLGVKERRGLDLFTDVSAERGRIKDLLKTEHEAATILPD